MKNYPIIIQDSKNDCGVCSLKMILNYYGIATSKEKIAKLTSTTEKGTSALDLIKASGKLGLKARGVASEIESLNSLPAIAHVILENSYAHYVVIYKIDYKNNKIIIGDPDYGLKHMTIDEFKKISSKIFIIFENKKSRPVKDLRFKNMMKKIINENKKQIRLALLLSIITIIFSLLSSLYLKTLLRSLPKIYIISTFFLIIMFLKNIFEYLKNKIISKLSINIDEKVNLSTYKHLFKLPYQYLNNKKEGEIFGIVNDLSDFKDSVSRLLIVFIIDIMMILVTTLFLITININYLVFIIIVDITYYLISLFYIGKFDVLFLKMKNDSIIMTSYLIELLSSIDTIKNLNIYEKVTDNLNQKYQDCLKNLKRYESTSNQYSFNKNLINDIFLVLIISISGLLVFNKKLEVYDIVLLDNIFYMLSGTINSILDNAISYKNCVVGINKVLNLYDIKEEKLNINKNHKFNNIKLDNLSIKLENKQLLQNTTLSINKGDHILLTGASGSGKSTLFKTILKYNLSYTGKVLFDNDNLNNVDAYTIRENITYTSQNEKLYSDSVYNNIVIGSKFISNINEVCQVAQIDKLLESKNADLNYFVEGQGTNLSGGEKKRIIIARSLLKNSSIIIFDESFNEIEPSMERKILNDMFEHYPNKTIIVISHRTANKDLFNKYWEIKNKKIKEEGLKI